MTSLRQIEANQRNALKSTGPTTSAGKDRSRRNAVRHGLSAETVVTPIENLEDYRAFEAAIISDYDVSTAVERELVLRLASLLWRLRRSTSIETGLLQMYAEGSGQSGYAEESVSLQFAAVTDACSNHEIARCFWDLASTGDPVFERVRRYEVTLWRQLRQTLSTLTLLSLAQQKVPIARSKHAWWRSATAPGR